MELDIVKFKSRMLMFEAQRWIGTKEIGGDNRGQLVEMFQKAVDGKASGESWCLSFVQFCVNMVDREFDYINQASHTPNGLFKTEHCMTLWQNTPKDLRLPGPTPGSLMIWQHGTTSSGHVGIVTDLLFDGKVKTVEGNTGPGANSGEVVREGDGVYERIRSREGSDAMKVVGWISPWKV